MGQGLFQPSPNGVDDRLLIGERSRLEFRVNQVTIGGDFETSARAGLEFQRADLLLVGRKNLFRQTDGFGFVVSDRAVFEVDLHGIPRVARVHDGADRRGADRGMRRVTSWFSSWPTWSPFSLWRWPSSWPSPSSPAIWPSSSPCRRKPLPSRRRTSGWFRLVRSSRLVTPK